jgi:2-oxoglutarate ferredoxin oxidoreductase subunit alpha
VANKKTKANNERLLFTSGNEAVAHGALYAGCNFFGGYPITPSTEIAELMSRELPKRGGTFIQMEDEIASMASIIGASIAGAKSMTATSGPGFSLMQENLGYAAITEIPCVIADVMRGGPSTGLPTKVSQADVMQARWGTHGDHPIIVLSPDSVQECFLLTIEAFNLSEKYRTPVVLLSDETIGHMHEVIELPLPGDLPVIAREEVAEIPPDWYKPYDFGVHNFAPLIPFGRGYRYHVTGLTHDESGFPTSRTDESEKMLTHLGTKLLHADDVCLTESIYLEDAEVVIIAYGCTARVCKRTLYAVRQEGIRCGMLRLKTLWPLPVKAIDEVCDQADLVVVPELNMGQIGREVERVNRGRANVFPINRIDGELFNPYRVAEQIIAHSLDLKDDDDQLII